MIATFLLLVASPALPPVLATASPRHQLETGLTKDEALKLAFGKAKVERIATYLNKQQLARLHQLAGDKSAGAAVRAYRATDDKGKLIGTAYFDAHQVRTKNEILMIVVAPDQSVSRIEVVQFGEPQEYIPISKWYAQFKGRKLDDKLVIKGAIRGFTGATLTAYATTKAVRRVLAAHQVVLEIETAKKQAEQAKKQKKENKVDGA